MVLWLKQEMLKFGNSSSNDFDLRRAGMGGSDLPDLKQEFSSVPHDRGTLSMARSSRSK